MAEKKEKVEEKKEKVEEKKEKVEEKKEKIEVISAVYKANLHCPQCAHDIRKPLLRTPGVHSVNVKFEKGEITVQGAFDAKKIHGQLEKWSKRKVELLSQAKVKEAEKKEETKKETVKTTVIKVYMHCDQCERDLRKRLLQHKGIHNVKTDMKAQTITIEGIIEPEKLLTYMQKRVHKHAEIIPPKEKKEEKKDEKKGEKKEETKEKVTVEVKSKETTDKKTGEKKEETKEKVTVEVKSKETTEVKEFEKEKKVEVKTDGHAPYFIHYVYAPQLFSDENPNACSIM